MAAEGPRSECLITAARHGHRHTTTFVAGLRSTGLMAPLVLDGPTHGSAFLAYVQQFLAPTLRPGGVVAIDNLAAQKVPASRTLSGPPVSACSTCRLTSPVVSLDVVEQRWRWVSRPPE